MRLQKECQCDVQNLPHVGVFILTYPNKFLKFPEVPLEFMVGVGSSVGARCWDLFCGFRPGLDSDFKPVAEAGQLQDHSHKLQVHIMEADVFPARTS